MEMVSIRQAPPIAAPMSPFPSSGPSVTIDDGHLRGGEFHRPMWRSTTRRGCVSGALALVAHTAAVHHHTANTTAAPPSVMRAWARTPHTKDATQGDGYDGVSALFASQKQWQLPQTHSVASRLMSGSTHSPSIYLHPIPLPSWVLMCAHSHQKRTALFCTTMQVRVKSHHGCTQLALMRANPHNSCMHNTHAHPPKLCVSGLVSHLTANSTAAGFKKKVRELTLTFHAARALVGAPALLCRLVRGWGWVGVDLRRVYVYKC
jgi:hypothetical protein